MSGTTQGTSHGTGRRRRAPARGRLLVVIVVIAVIAALAAAGGACTTSPGADTSAGTTSPAGTSPTPGTAPGAADFAGTVDIGGGRKMYLECTGTGGPTVVLVSGQRASAQDWHRTTSTASPPAPAVFGEVARTNRVCAYDRPGTPVGNGFSRSDPTPQPTTAAAGAADLQAVLAAAGERGPFVVVGHSAGGMIVRLFAAAHPDDVVGMVLVDPPSEFLQDNETPEQWKIQDLMMQGDITEDLAIYPDIERFDAGTSFSQLRAAPPLKPMPLVVLSADEKLGPALPGLIAAGVVPAGVPADFGFVFDAANAKAQAQLAQLVPNAVHVTETHSGHDIHLIQPQLVVDAIHQVIDASAQPR